MPQLGIYKNALGPVGIPLKKGASGQKTQHSQAINLEPGGQGLSVSACVTWIAVSRYLCSVALTNLMSQATKPHTAETRQAGDSIHKSLFVAVSFLFIRCKFFSYSVRRSGRVNYWIYLICWYIWWMFFFIYSSFFLCLWLLLRGFVDFLKNFIYDFSFINFISRGLSLSVSLLCFVIRCCSIVLMSERWYVMRRESVVVVWPRYPWCNGYRRRKWTWRHVFKFWTRLIAFHMTLIPLGKVWIQLLSLQLWINSRADCVLQPWWGN